MFCHGAVEKVAVLKYLLVLRSNLIMIAFLPFFEAAFGSNFIAHFIVLLHHRGGVKRVIYFLDNGRAGLL